MAIEKVLNVTPDEAIKIESEVHGNTLDEANSERDQTDIDIYGE